METTLVLLLLATRVCFLAVILNMSIDWFIQLEVSAVASSNKTRPVSEAHPDMIDTDGVASLEAYSNDLAYLKRKVLVLYMIQCIIS